MRGRRRGSTWLAALYFLNFSVNPQCSLKKERKKESIKGKGNGEKRRKKAALHVGPGSQWALSEHQPVHGRAAQSETRTPARPKRRRVSWKCTLDNLRLQPVLSTEGCGSGVTRSYDSARKLETWILGVTPVWKPFLYTGRAASAGQVQPWGCGFAALPDAPKSQSWDAVSFWLWCQFAGVPWGWVRLACVCVHVALTTTHRCLLAAASSGILQSPLESPLGGLRMPDFSWGYPCPPSQMPGKVLSVVPYFIDCPV